MSENLNGSEVLEMQPAPGNRGTCQTCRFGQISLSADSIMLNCRESSPQIMGNVVQVINGRDTNLQWFSQAAWPTVGKDEWCGKWQQDPNAVKSGAKSIIEHDSAKAS